MFTSDLLATTTPAPADLLFTTRDKVKAQLGSFATDDKIDALIEQVSGELDAGLGYPAANGGGHSLAECGYTLTIWAQESYLSLNMQRRFLTEKPVVSVNGTELDPAAVVCDLDKGDIRLVCGTAKDRWPCGKIAFTFTAGFVMPPVSANPSSPSRRLPKQLERAAIDLIAYRHTLSTGQPCGSVLKQMNLPGAGMLAFDIPTPPLGDGAIPGHVAAMIEPWRYARDGQT